jgi:hypothetical protein
MADFKDKYSGQQYRISTFSTLKTAVESNPIVDGRRHEQFSGSEALKVLPYRLKRGDQAKFFPGLADGTTDGGIATGSSVIRDTERGIVYVPITKKNYQKNLIGVGSHVSSTFSSGAYLQISAAFAQKFSGVSDDTLITYCVEEFYNSPSASRSAFNVPDNIAGASSTDLFSPFPSGSTRPTTESFSAIDSGSTVLDGKTSKFKFTFDRSEYASHWTLTFPGPGSQLGSATVVANAWTPSVLMKFDGHTPYSASFVTDSGLSTDTPSKFMTYGNTNEGVKANNSSHLLNAGGNLVYSNGTNNNDGEYVSHNFKYIVASDADSGSKYADKDSVQIIVYPSSSLGGTAADGGTLSVGEVLCSYSKTSRLAALTSTNYKRLYFIKGDGHAAQGSSDFGGLYIPASGQGAPVHEHDKNLRHNATRGFYSPSGSSTATIEVKSGSLAVSGQGPTFAYDLQS